MGWASRREGKALWMWPKRAGLLLITGEQGGDPGGRIVWELLNVFLCVMRADPGPLGCSGGIKRPLCHRLSSSPHSPHWVPLLKSFQPPPPPNLKHPPKHEGCQPVTSARADLCALAQLRISRCGVPLVSLAQVGIANRLPVVVKTVCRTTEGVGLASYSATGTTSLQPQCSFC